MKKFLMIAGVSLIAFGAAQPTSVYAEEATNHEEHDHANHHDGHGEHTDHYEGIKLESAEHAFEVLDEKTAEIAEILKKEGGLEFLDLEGIHEITYTLEASVDKIREDKAAPESKIDTLDEAVQAIHFASEKQKEAKVREWFAKLEPAAGDLKVKEEGAAPVKREFYEIVIKDHKFSPEEITVPAGEKIKLIIDNQDPTPEEFESHDMNREKIIRGNKKATIYVGPLEPGKYHFFGEFNMDTANGYIIAK